MRVLIFVHENVACLCLYCVNQTAIVRIASTVSLTGFRVHLSWLWHKRKKLPNCLSLITINSPPDKRRVLGSFLNKRLRQSQLRCTRKPSWNQWTLYARWQFVTTAPKQTQAHYLPSNPLHSHQASSSPPSAWSHHIKVQNFQLLLLPIGMYAGKKCFCPMLPCVRSLCFPVCMICDAFDLSRMFIDIC